MITVTRADVNWHTKGDITGLIMSCAKEILSICSPGGSTRRDVGSVGAFGTPIMGKGGHRGQRWHRSKERWCFPIGSPL